MTVGVTRAGDDQGDSISLLCDREEQWRGRCVGS
jgi:hypothetical protein